MRMLTGAPQLLQNFMGLYRDFVTSCCVTSALHIIWYDMRSMRDCSLLANLGQAIDLPAGIGTEGEIVVLAGR